MVPPQFRDSWCDMTHPHDTTWLIHMKWQVTWITYETVKTFPVSSAAKIGRLVMWHDWSTWYNMTHSHVKMDRHASFMLYHMTHPHYMTGLIPMIRHDAFTPCNIAQRDTFTYEPVNHLPVSITPRDVTWLIPVMQLDSFRHCVTSCVSHVASSTMRHISFLWYN